MNEVASTALIEKNFQSFIALMKCNLISTLSLQYLLIRFECQGTNKCHSSLQESLNVFAILRCVFLKLLEMQKNYLLCLFHLSFPHFLYQKRCIADHNKGQILQCVFNYEHLFYDFLCFRIVFFQLWLGVDFNLIYIVHSSITCISKILSLRESIRIRNYSGPHFPAYRGSLRIQSECRKIRAKITPITDTFYAVCVLACALKYLDFYATL